MTNFECKMSNMWSLVDSWMITIFDAVTVLIETCVVTLTVTHLLIIIRLLITCLCPQILYHLSAITLLFPMVPISLTICLFSFIYAVVSPVMPHLLWILEVKFINWDGIGDLYQYYVYTGMLLSQINHYMLCLHGGYSCTCVEHKLDIEI